MIDSQFFVEWNTLGNNHLKPLAASRVNCLPRKLVPRLNCGRVQATRKTKSRKFTISPRCEASVSRTIIICFVELCTLANAFNITGFGCTVLNGFQLADLLK